MGYTGKYLPLKEYLIALSKDQEVLSFKDIESILKFPLPDSAYVHKDAYWNNGGHNYSNSWLEAGWLVDIVEVPNKVIFVKNKHPNRFILSDKTHRKGIPMRTKKKYRKTNSF